MMSIELKREVIEINEKAVWVADFARPNFNDVYFA